MCKELIPRNDQKTLRSLIQNNQQNKNVILVEGARQVGKTTVVTETLKELKKPHLSLNLEKQKIYRASIDRCNSFKEFEQWLLDEFGFKPDQGKILFIDEAQESQNLGYFVRSFKEDWNNATVILSGSMMTRLFRGETRYPVGRVDRVIIRPFSFFEFLIAQERQDWVLDLTNQKFDMITPNRHQKLLQTISLYFQQGGLPLVVCGALENKPYQKIIQEIYQDYREDFIRVFGDELSFLFNRSMQAVSDHVGSPSKLTQALSQQEKGYSKLSEVFSKLELWHMIHTSLQRGPQPEGTTQFHPKKYLFDLGLLNCLRTIGVPNIDLLKTIHPDQRRSIGGIFENYVANFLINFTYPLSGFKQSSSGMEIDFIFKFKNQTIPIECKASLKTKDTHLKGLKKYMADYHLNLGVVLNAAPFEIRNYSFGRIISCPCYALEVLPEIIHTQINGIKD